MYSPIKALVNRVSNANSLTFELDADTLLLKTENRLAFDNWRNCAHVIGLTTDTDTTINPLRERKEFWLLIGVPSAADIEREVRFLSILSDFRQWAFVKALANQVAREFAWQDDELALVYNELVRRINHGVLVSESL